MLPTVDANDRRRLRRRRLHRLLGHASGRGLHELGPELPVQQAHAGRERQPLQVRLGGGRLQQQDLYQGPGRGVRRQAHAVRHLRRGPHVQQLQQVSGKNDIKILIWPGLKPRLYAKLFRPEIHSARKSC